MRAEEKVRLIKTILHSPRGRDHAPIAYENLLDIIIKIDATGDITNRQLNDLRTILDKLGEVDEVLNGQEPVVPLPKINQ